MTPHINKVDTSGIWRPSNKSPQAKDRNSRISM